MKIIGAGLAGLLAAHAWPQAKVLEAQAEPKAAHRALLRFRTEEVARLTGVEFRPVTVHKGVWLEDCFVSPSIQLANWYAQKVTGTLSGNRSIWNLDPVKRFVAPETFYQQLIEAIGHRIQWGTQFNWSTAEAPILSTVPLPIVLKALNIPKPENITFHRSPIRVERYRVEGADLFQTIYYPLPHLDLYRASITGSLLIVESVITTQTAIVQRPNMRLVARSFGLNPDHNVKHIESVEQHYGKIVPLPDALRKPLLLKLTQQHGIFSLGRFATWRNILLDDVVQDITVLRRLMKASGYDRAIFAS